MDASKCSVHSVFNGYRILEIPFFQRAYVWKKPQWKRFLEDMEFISKSGKPYFLGSIILKQQETNTGSGERRTVIDGQQRLTTLSIFLKVLSLKIKDPNIISMLKIAAQNNAVALQHNYHDLPAFNKVINLKDEGKIEGTDLISEAYRYFSEHVNPAKLNFQKLFANISFVVIDLSYQEDEQQIFDTINSLGVKLTTAELLKNYLFERDQMDIYKEFWFDIFESDKNSKSYWDTQLYAGRFERSLIDLFFYSYLQIKIQDPNLAITSDDKIGLTKVTGLFYSYKAMLEKYKVDKKEFLNEVREYARIFRKSFNPNVYQSELTNGKQLDRMSLIVFSLDTTTLISYMLYVLKNAEESEAVEILKYLESYIMRRMVCHANTKNYNQLFSERLIINQVLTKKKLKEFIETQADLVNFMPSNKELREGFMSSKLVNNQSKGILYLIESKVRNHSRQSTALRGFEYYQLEHLMPKKWLANWNDGLSDPKKEKRDRKLLTLGNLSILSGRLNAAIKNSSWETKKSGTKSGSGLDEYAAGLETIHPYLKKKKWDEKAIEERAEFLYEKASEAWPA